MEDAAPPASRSPPIAGRSFGRACSSWSRPPGRPTRDGRLYVRAGIIHKATGRAYVQAHRADGSNPPALAWERPLTFAAPLLHILLLDSDREGRVYLGVETASEDPATHKTRCRLSLNDITEQKRLDDMLRQLNVELEQLMTERTAEVRDSEARYRSLVTAPAQIVWTTNAQGEVIADIPTWRAFTGQSYNETKGWGWAKPG